MPINYASKGIKLKLTGKDDWDGGGLDNALKYLSLDIIYTIKYIDMGDYVDYVCLEEFPNDLFNYGLFEKIKL